MILTKNEIIDSYINLTDNPYSSNIAMGDYDKDKPTILIIDDYESVITMAKRLVKRMHLEKCFNVVYASGYDAILNILQTVHDREDLIIDIVISDITFGASVRLGNINYAFNGITLVEILKELNNDLIYLFITGHNINKDATPQYYDEYIGISSIDSLDEHITLKDEPISTNKAMIVNLLSGTPYEQLLSTCAEGNGL